MTNLTTLIESLGTITKENKIPTSRKLRENAGEPIACCEGCTVYKNGYAVYENESGRTVMWLPDCMSFTYRFNPRKDTEDVSIPDARTIGEDFFGEQPWHIAVMVCGEHRIEENMMNRKGTRSGTMSSMKYDEDELDALERMDEDDPYEKEYSWRESRYTDNPEDIYIRKETQELMLEKLTEKQRAVFTLYYRDGYTQQEISSMLGISRDSVNDRLEAALKKIKKTF